MQRIVRLLQEPLFHFFVFGGLIFLIYAAVSGPVSGPVEVIVVGPERIKQLTARFEAVWRRPPGDDELRGLIDDFVREEIYYREGLALGLDRNDTIIRRRLRQKMEFLTDTGADLLEPAAGELETHLAANAQIFLRPARLAFEQVFLGEHPLEGSIEVSLNALRSDPESDPSAWSKRTLLPARLELSPPDVVDGTFGNGFFERLAELPTGEWGGPVSSAYGMHLVRINELEPARMPALEEVRDAVLRDWKTRKAQELRELHYASLKQRYRVEIRDTNAPGAESR